MILYHGTRAAFLPQILEQGVKPRGDKDGNWQHTVTSNPYTVYLSVCYGLYFAMNARDQAGLPNGNVAILEIDTDKLDHQRLVPDEDAIERATRDATVEAVMT